MKSVDIFMNQNGKSFWSTYHDPGGYRHARHGGWRVFPLKSKRDASAKPHLTGNICSLPLGNKEKSEK